ncbi:MAG: hypothetical protein JWR83_427, partial [Aeromicrobium sp.]|nr:hypothetical protein [Aeromicrobium sp.]
MEAGAAVVEVALAVVAVVTGAVVGGGSLEEEGDSAVELSFVVGSTDGSIVLAMVTVDDSELESESLQLALANAIDASA